MSEVKVDLTEYQVKYDRFIVIKDYYKIGSAVMGFDASTDLDFRALLSKCLLIAKSPLQVVRLGGPRPLFIYGEYGPYTVYDNKQDLLDICISGKCPGEVNPFIKDTIYKEEQADVIKQWREECLANE